MSENHFTFFRIAAFCSLFVWIGFMYYHDYYFLWMIVHEFHTRGIKSRDTNNKSTLKIKLHKIKLIFNCVLLRTYRTLCVRISFAALWFSIGELSECGDTWLATLWVCAIQLPDARKSWLAYYHCGTRLVENRQFPYLQLAKAGIIAQECGSFVVYWVTVVSADPFCVSNSIFSPRIK